MVTNDEILTAREILENYSNHLASKGKTRAHYLRFATEFLDYAAGDYSRMKVEKFLDHMKAKHKYGQGSLNFAFRVVRTVYERNKMDWPFNRGEAPMVRENDVNAPALNPVTIRRMIATSRGSDNIEARTCLVLSTLYGLRREEMANLKQEDVRIKDRTIYIGTLKHGRERSHLIPDRVVHYLEEFDFDRARSEFLLLQWWYQLESYISLKHIDKVGWHSIRRTLDTLLLKDFSETDVRSFMRWKQRTSQNMTFRYSATKFVGEEEDVVELSGESLQVDAAIFKKHPFLSEW